AARDAPGPAASGRGGIAFAAGGDEILELVEGGEAVETVRSLRLDGAVREHDVSVFAGVVGSDDAGRTLMRSLGSLLAGLVPGRPLVGEILLRKRLFVKLLRGGLLDAPVNLLVSRF